MAHPSPIDKWRRRTRRCRRAKRRGVSRTHRQGADLPSHGVRVRVFPTRDAVRRVSVANKRLMHEDGKAEILLHEVSNFSADRLRGVSVEEVLLHEGGINSNFIADRLRGVSVREVLLHKGGNNCEGWG